MADNFNPLNHPVCLQQPRRLVLPDAWVEHIPFGMLLIDLVRPKILVELGTHSGNSYCAFCQAVQELELPTKCYAVDTWEGDKQSGNYDSEVLEDLRKHHDPLYNHFSRLLQTTFDDAIEEFDDRSIDLLHIDGLHTYDAVSHDFKTWLPKMSDQGIVVFHDTVVRVRDFGVWKLWQELNDSHPSFEFSHGHGLGIIAVGTKIEPEMEHFLSISDVAKEVRGLFHRLGSRLSWELSAKIQRNLTIELKTELLEKENSVKTLEANLFEKEQEILSYTLSKSWRLTRPFRILGSLIKGK